MERFSLSRPQSIAVGVVATVAVLWGVLSWGGWHPGPETIAEGRALFEHEWQPGDPLSGEGDGLGPVFNANSCKACHFQGGVGGSGPNHRNVLAFEAHPTPANPEVGGGVVHAAAVSPALRESQEIISTLFPVLKGATRVESGCTITFADFDPVRFESINTPALFGNGLIDGISGGAIRRNAHGRTLTLMGQELQGDFEGTPIGRPRVLADGRVGKFGWKGQFATLEEFVATACAVEMGLTNPLRAQDVPRKHVEDTEAKLDMTGEQLYALVSFVDSLPSPAQVVPEDPAGRASAVRGHELFLSIGCADCHTPNLGGVEGIYSDLLLHVLEDDPGASYGRQTPPVPLPGEHPRPEEWKTPPLWGVADTAPYFHDGGSPTLESSILRHRGQAKRVRERYEALRRNEQAAVIAFLKTLRAPQQQPEAEMVAAHD
jgi:CxxC motif-containing protein (DUF1111 family)